ncbi:TfoX/Sxy family DNA transformation protein [Methanolobus sp. ZRKC3]|uniref:TfoX/Sxy family DNA transformation protein n=1 Tax=Methanolobus sp. ZRKC3 TaxID=3125786 RepID=UPI00325558EB
MSELQELPNIGKKLDEQLRQIGVNNIDNLRNIGTKAAFERIKLVDENACINKLYAIEGAIKGIRHHQLPAKDKADLKYYFNSLK